MTTLTRLVIIALCAAVALFACSCTHGPSGPDKSNSRFSVSITVKDGSGNAVPGLRVSAYYSPSIAGLAKASASRPTRMLASSSVTFDAAYPAFTDLSLHELNGTLVHQLIDHRLCNAGRYMVMLSLHQNVGTRVYVCRLTSVDTSASRTVFRDSIYVTLWQPDPSIAVLGYTGPNGTFTTQDSLAFPHLLSLPPMIRTDVAPDAIATFSFPDSVNFVLTDTSSMRFIAAVRKIVPGTNVVSLAWNPVPSINGRQSAIPLPARSVVGDSIVVRVPTQWKLYQNYPNPFN